MNNTLVSLYKNAWENHDINIIENIFHKDIIYQEHCDNVICGISNLIKYWIKNSKKQSRVRFEPINIIENNHDIVILWMARFHETQRNKEVQLEGIMWLTIEDGKIKKLIEFFEHK